MPRSFLRRHFVSKQISLKARRLAAHKAIQCAIEPLEQRLVFAALAVNTLLDNTTSDNFLSLREAVDLINNAGNANAAVGHGLTGAESNQIDTTQSYGTNDTITFAPSLGGGTISLDEGPNVFGRTAMDLTASMTIDGGTKGITLTGGGNGWRAFYVSSVSTVVLSRMTIENFINVGSAGGSGAGGGGGGAGMGGAIYSAGDLSLDSVTMNNNIAQGGNGGAGGVGGTSGGGGGGGVFSDGADASGVVGGQGSNGVTGGGFDSDGNGGGLGEGGGGGGASSGVVPGNGGGGGFGGGGGGGGSTDITNSAGVGGDGGFGAGGGGSSPQQIGGTTFGGAAGFGAGGGGSSNVNTGGGGAGLGGAVFNDAGLLTITNSTFTANSALGGVGASNGQGIGGAIFVHNGLNSVNSTTISGNIADDARGLYVLGDGVQVAISVDNSILGQTDSTIHDYNADTINGGGIGPSGGNNVIANNGFVMFGYSQADPLLGALQDNGGPTFTMRPSAISIALNSGHSGGSPSTDQRGFARPVGLAFDIGSVESASATLTVDTTADTDTRDNFLSLREAMRVINGTLLINTLTSNEQADITGTIGDQHIIQFNSSLGGSTISLGTADDSTFGPTAFAVTNEVSINGITNPNVGGITIARDTNAAPSRLRLFYVTDTGRLTLDHISLTDGLAQGGNGLSGGGGAAGLGGAILNAGGLTLRQSTLSNNTAQGGNGSNTFMAFAAAGGGLAGNGTSSGGGPNGATSGTDADFGGGGYNARGDAGFGGGGGGNGGTGGFGGGGGGGNSGQGAAGFGAGDANGGGGGGAGMGGAIFNYGGTVAISNSTLANNTALGGSGGFNGVGYGGGLFNLNGTVNVLSSTFAYNQADIAGTSYNLGIAQLGTQAGPALADTRANINVNNSILAASYNGTVSNLISDEDYFNTASGDGGATLGTVNVNGQNNLLQTGNDDFGNSLRADAKFAGSAATASGRLIDYGGVTKTVGLLPTSPAIDAGLLGLVPALQLSTDQRDATRVHHAQIDIGAFESQGYTLTTDLNATPQSAATSAQFTNALGATLTENAANKAIGGATVGFAVNTAGTQSATLSSPAITDASGHTSVTATANSNGGAYTVDASATGAVTGHTATTSFALTNVPAPTITSADHVTFAVGSAGSFTITTTGSPIPAISKTGTLPSGVTLVDNHDGTATLSGTPAATTGNVYSVNITAANGNTPDASQTFTLTVNEAPSITSLDHVDFVRNTAGTFTVTTGGYPHAAITKTGSLPVGVTLVDNNNGTATISGTPTAAGASYSLTLHAGNGVGSAADQSFTVNVNEAPAVTSVNNATGTVGSPMTFNVTSSGFPAATYGEMGTLPTGITLNSTTGVLSGTPAASTGGSYPITVTATNGIGSAAQQSFTLTVNQAPAISSANNATFTINALSTFVIHTSGFPLTAITKTGSLPAGVTLVDNSDGTATLSGTPTASGTFPITLHAGNGVGSAASQSFTLDVSAQPGITSADNTSVIAGTPLAFTVTWGGFPAATISQTGTLPTGVSFDTNTGLLSGTPAGSAGGVYPISFTASNGVGTDATQNFTLTVNQVPAILSADHITFTAGTVSSFVIQTSGYPTGTIGETGTLASGITFVDNHDGTATLSGTPSYAAGGVYAISLGATNGIGADSTQAFTLTVDVPRPIVISNSNKGSTVVVNNPDGSVRFTIADPFPGMKVGRRVAMGDVNGDGVADVIVGAASGKKPQVAIFDGVTGEQLANFTAFSKSFHGGVYVSSGDVNGDGKADIIVGRGAGSQSRIRVFSGADQSMLSDFKAFAANGAVRVASADINGDGHADIVAGQSDSSGTSKVRVFDGLTLTAKKANVLSTITPFGKSFKSGTYVATGDINGDDHPDIIVSRGNGSKSRILAFNGIDNAVITDIHTPSKDGIRLASSDFNNDGHDDIFASVTISGVPSVMIFSGADNTLLDTLGAGANGSVFVA